MPVIGFFAYFMRKKESMPLIVPAIIITNGVWWVTFNYLDAFIWATIAHSIQYLVIIFIFQHKESNKPSRSFFNYSFKIFGICIILGYVLFNVWPYAYELLGLGYAESLLIVAAIINIHHFYVDGFIWKQSKPKRQIA